MINIVTDVNQLKKPVTDLPKNKDEQDVIDDVVDIDTK